MAFVFLDLFILEKLEFINFFFLNLQSQHDELEAKFLEERAALEAKYQKLYQPLYTKVGALETHLHCVESSYCWLLCFFFTVLNVLDADLFLTTLKVIGCLFMSLSINYTENWQRYEIVNGVVEAEGVTDEAATEEEDKAAEGTFFTSILYLSLFFFFLWVGFMRSLMLDYIFMQRKEYLTSGSLQ